MLESSTSHLLSQEFNNYVGKILAYPLVRYQESNTDFVALNPIMINGPSNNPDNINQTVQHCENTTVSNLDEDPTSTEDDEEDMLEFKCWWKACNEGFSTRGGLATHCGKHVKKILKGNAPFRCHWGKCSDSFDTARLLIKHLSEPSHIGRVPFVPKKARDLHVPDKEKIYSCTFIGCGKRFRDPSNRNKHLLIHNTVRQRYHCTYPDCKRSYSTVTDMKIHYQQHEGNFPHKCSHKYCGRAFLRRSELYVHERVHDDINPYKCNQCGLEFRELRRIKNHMMDQHGIEFIEY